MNLFSALFHSYTDYRREKKISVLYREYNGYMRDGKTELAGAVMRDIRHEVEQRSLRVWSREKQQKVAKLDPHARVALQQESRA